MVDKVHLPKKTFKRFVNEKYKINNRDFSALLKIYLPLYKDGNKSSFLAYIIAKCYLNLFDYASSEKWIKEAIALEPLDKYYHFLAYVYEVEYEYEKAIKLILASLREHPYDEWALHTVIGFYIQPGGEEYFPQGFVRECLIKLVNRNKDNNLPFYCLELAKIEFSNGEYAVAEELLNKAVLSLEPIAPILLKDIEDLLEKIWDKK